MINQEKPPEVLTQAQAVVDRFGDFPDFRSTNISPSEVDELIKTLLNPLEPYVSELGGTTLSLHEGLLKWLDSGRGQDRICNLRGHLYQLSYTLLAYGLKGEQQDSFSDIPY